MKFALASTLAAVAFGVAVENYSSDYYGEGTYTNPAPKKGHNSVWGHAHYEPGNIDRFIGHGADIYGADDLAWGPNGYRTPFPASDNVHNWDDQGDAYICHSCGGHGCGNCGGYGHHHRNSKWGYHGHTLKKGFGTGHWHTYLGDKPRSTYNKYGNGIGGRYSQRWSNGYGDQYGINAGQRYGLAHTWGMYNGYGRGNPTSKGSNMGYGYNSNAQTPVRTEGYTKSEYGTY
jgi:hypothetical protein